jgi:hypothetical protein
MMQSSVICASNILLCRSYAVVEATGWLYHSCPRLPSSTEGRNFHGMYLCVHSTDSMYWPRYRTLHGLTSRPTTYNSRPLGTVRKDGEIMVNRRRTDAVVPPCPARRGQEPKILYCNTKTTALLRWRTVPTSYNTTASLSTVAVVDAHPPRSIRPLQI